MSDDMERYARAAAEAIEMARQHPQEWHVQRRGLLWYVEALGPHDGPSGGRYGWITGPFWFRRSALRHINREKARRREP